MRRRYLWRFKFRCDFSTDLYRQTVRTERNPRGKNEQIPLLDPLPRLHIWSPKKSQCYRDFDRTRIKNWQNCEIQSHLSIAGENKKGIN